MQVDKLGSTGMGLYETVLAPADNIAYADLMKNHQGYTLVPTEKNPQGSVTETPWAYKKNSNDNGRYDVLTYTDSGSAQALAKTTDSVTIGDDITKDLPPNDKDSLTGTVYETFAQSSSTSSTMLTTAMIFSASGHGSSAIVMVLGAYATYKLGKQVISSCSKMGTSLNSFWNKSASATTKIVNQEMSTGEPIEITVLK